MKICLFCENKYAVDILNPLQEEADREGSNTVLWYVHKKKIPEFPLKKQVDYTNDIQEVYRFHPDVIFVPGNIVPYYLSGVKVQIFHGYAAEKKDHWIIRRYFDTYFTQGRYFTSHFEDLSKKYKDFEVLETGWTRQDWVYANRSTYDKQRQELLKKHGKSRIVLYAPTFSPKLTSLPHISHQLQQLANDEDVLILIKLHPLTKPEWVEQYRALARDTENIEFIDDFSISPYIMMSDVMISDTSSTVYEMLLQDKPVITLRTVAQSDAIYWCNILQPEQLNKAFHEVIDDKGHYAELRRWIIDNYDPYLDGKVAHRMLDGARDYIRRHGVPEQRKLNLWRKYTSIKTFGWPK